MNFIITSWYDLSKEEKKTFQNKTKEELVNRWDTDEGREIRRKILEINFTRGNSKNYAPFVGFCTSKYFKNQLLLDLRGFDLSLYSNLFSEKIVSLDFSFCNLEFSSFYNSELAKCNFSSSELSNSNFSSSLLDEGNFSNSNLSFCNFSLSQLERVNFKRSFFNNTNLFKSNISELYFNKKTDFKNIDLEVVNNLDNYSFYKFLKKKKKYKKKSKNNIFYKLIYQCLY